MIALGAFCYGCKGHLDDVHVSFNRGEDYWGIPCNDRNKDNQSDTVHIGFCDLVRLNWCFILLCQGDNNIIAEFKNLNEAYHVVVTILKNGLT